MSISLTLGNAMTGLSAASRSAQIVSNNVANATTEGYARREIELSARLTGGLGSGVQVDGVRRIVDENLLREHRLAAASLAQSTVASGFQRDALDALGEPQDPSSLTATVARFETALLAATSRPESDSRLYDVLNSAQSLVSKLNDASGRVQVLRQDADRAIAREITRLNTTLGQIADLNAQILRARGSDQDYPSLLDSRQRLIGEISDLVSIRVLARENDTIALYTTNGALLVDATPAEFAFQETALITPDMTIGSGALSGVTLNGRPIGTAGENSPIAGGRLSGLFAVRDDLAPELQGNLDAMARDLVTRFEDPSLDVTLAVGDAGLFTDGGDPLDPLDVPGLAGRLGVNAAADPEQGGAIWRLRDGLGASSPGPVGDPALLVALADRMQDMRVPVGGTISPTARDFATFSADLVSLTGLSLQDANARTAFEQSRFTGLNQALLAEGVDTDQELQKLLLIEQSFAANARVIQTADELIQILIGL